MLIDIIIRVTYLIRLAQMRIHFPTEYYTILYFYLGLVFSMEKSLKTRKLKSK